MRPALTRSSIVAAARELLLADGLDAVSLRRIAAHLGVTAPALYAYVTDKRDLLRAIAGLEVEKLLRSFDAIEERDPVERLDALAREYLQFAQANPELFRAVFLTRPELTSDAFDGEPALSTRLLERVTDAMRAALDGRIENPNDACHAALTFWSAVHGGVVMLLTGPRLHPDDARELVGSVTRATLRGLGFERERAGVGRTH